ncbi:MAG TPA: S26 family signal peptidase [Methanotrichaceae archaeon]|nr:S26 family signal peptidase [Methanotrichaceae archaeon]
MKGEAGRSCKGGDPSRLGSPGPASGSARYFSHKGSSMIPALFEGDLLELFPYIHEPIRTGDVVIFHSPVDGTSIAHRVVSVSDRGISVRGDNNDDDDPWVLSPSSIDGRVKALWRGRRKKKVYGGRSGRALSRLGRLEVGLYRVMVPYLSRVCRHASRTGTLRIASTFILRPKVIMTGSKDGHSMVLSAWGRAAGSYDPGTGRWRIGWFYRFFIDEADLPRCTGPDAGLSASGHSDRR